MYSVGVHCVHCMGLCVIIIMPPVYVCIHYSLNSEMAEVTLHVLRLRQMYKTPLVPRVRITKLHYYCKHSVLSIG